MNVCKCHRHLDTIHISPLFEYHRAIFLHACTHTEHISYIQHILDTHTVWYMVFFYFFFFFFTRSKICTQNCMECVFALRLFVPFYSNIFCFHILLFAPTASLTCTSGENFLNCLIVYSLIRFSTGSYCWVCVCVCAVFFFSFLLWYMTNCGRKPHRT